MIKNICLSLAASAALFSGAAQAASEYLIKINGINGTSTLVGFTDYIEVESWSVGFTKGICQDLHFVKEMDAASADLTGAVLVKITYPTVTLIARRAGRETPFTYMKLTLANSVFTSFQVGGSAGGSLIPFEQISLSSASGLFELFGEQADGTVVKVAENSFTCKVK